MRILLVVALAALMVWMIWSIGEPRRRARKAMVAGFGLDQVRGMTLDQAIFAWRIGAIRVKDPEAYDDIMGGK